MCHQQCFCLCKTIGLTYCWPDLTTSYFPLPQDVTRIFGNLPELYELSVQLLSSMEECIEMAGELEGEERCPHAGFVFEELAEVYQFDYS